MNAARRAPSFRPTDTAAPTAGLFAFIAVISFGAVAAALVSQYRYGMDPCPWCVLDRLTFIAIGFFAVLGLVWRQRAGSRFAATLAVLLGVAGFAATMWQHFVAAKSASCNLTLADRIMTTTQLDRLLPEVFEPRASCADAAVSLLGVPYDFLAAAVFVACVAAAFAVLRRAAR